MHSFTATCNAFASAGIGAAYVADNCTDDMTEHGEGHVICTGRLSVDLSTGVVSVGGRRVKLTGKEYAILKLLTLRKGTTLSKEMFLEHLYGGTDEPEMKIIDVFVCYLRKKLAQATGGEHCIQTVWGRGYILCDPPAAPPLSTSTDLGACDSEAGRATGA